MNLAIAIKKGQSPLNSSAIPTLVCIERTCQGLKQDEVEYGVEGCDVREEDDAEDDELGVEHEQPRKDDADHPAAVADAPVFVVAASTSGRRIT